MGTSPEDLAQWIGSLSEDRCRFLLYFLCGYKPEIVRALYRMEKES